MIFAYCRVSTESQSLKRQMDNISAAYPEISPNNYYCDKWTGADMNRPAWVRLLKRVRSGDCIVFDSVSRMSRDAAEGAAMYERLFADGVELVFLNEPHINTAVYKEPAQAPATGNADLDETLIRGLNEYLLRLARRQIYIAFEQAEKERKDISKRVRDGMKAAKAEAAERGEELTFGAVPGKKLVTAKSKAAKEIIREHSKTFGGSLDDEECRKLAGIARNTFYRYKGQLKEELGRD